jgi:nitroreductase
MELLQAIRERHSVRRYTDRKIEPEIRARLQDAAQEANRESGLRIQLCFDEPTAFGSMLAHYGMFHNVQNYIALVGKDGAEEACGYYGEKLVLLAQTLGLNSCWVAMSYSKKKSRRAVQILPEEKLIMVISLGYGVSAGKQHKSKPLEALGNLDAASPAWFRSGLEAAQLAPTAVNQQKFYFERMGDRVEARAGKGPCTKTDLGIAKYHFELGAKRAVFSERP